MTPAHVFFIPSVFFLGLLVGAIATARFQRAAPATPHSGSAQVTGKTSARSVVLAFIVFAVVFAATHLSPQFGGAKAITVAMHGMPILDQRPSFSSADVYARLDAFGPVGRGMYQRFTYSVDVVFPLSLLIFLSLLARFVTQRTGLNAGWRPILLALPFAWFISDMLENAMVFSLIANFPIQNDLLGGIVGYVTAVKFSLLLLSIAVPAVCLVVLQRGATARSTIPGA